MYWVMGDPVDYDSLEDSFTCTDGVGYRAIGTTFDIRLEFGIRYTTIGMTFEVG